MNERMNRTGTPAAGTVVSGHPHKALAAAEVVGTTTLLHESVASNIGLRRFPSMTGVVLHWKGSAQRRP